jgi:hypothetical protein
MLGAVVDALVNLVNGVDEPGRAFAFKVTGELMGKTPRAPMYFISRRLGQKEETVLNGVSGASSEYASRSLSSWTSGVCKSDQRRAGRAMSSRGSALNRCRRYFLEGDVLVFVSSLTFAQSSNDVRSSLASHPSASAPNSWRSSTVAD